MWEVLSRIQLKTCKVWKRFRYAIADESEVDSDGSQALAKDLEHKSPNDYRRHQESSQVMIFSWKWIDKIDDHKKKNLVGMSLVVWNAIECVQDSRKHIEDPNKTKNKQKMEKKEGLDLEVRAYSNQMCYTLHV